MAHIQFGFCMPAEMPSSAHDKTGRATYIEDLNRALELVTGHFDSAWFVDHLQFGDRDLLEGFAALTYMAALHPGLKFGHAVLCQSFRNPTLVAKMGATLQYLSRGRFILGLGAGWNEKEYRSFGYDFPKAGVRVEQLDEAIQIIKAMWTRDEVTFEGNHYRVNGARCEPKPEPIPTIMIGAFKPRMLRLAARYADWWNVSSSGVARYRRMTDELERACAEIGRDPATIKRTWIGGCACASTEEKAKAFAKDLYNPDSDDDSGFVGTPKQVIEQMRSFVDMGVDYFMLDCGGFPDLTTLEMLVSEVLPALNDTK